MRIVNASHDGWTVIGRQGENESTTVRFPAGDVFEEYPDAEVVLLHQRRDDPSAYPVDPALVTIAADGAVEWLITNSDTAKVGRGQVQLDFMQNNAVVRSMIYTTSTLPGLGSNDVPEPWVNWVRELMESNRAAVAAGENAAERAQAAKNSAQAAGDSAAEAGRKVEEAAGRAQAAGEAATTAWNGAGASGSSAQQAANSAGAAAAAASAARDAAGDAARSAEYAAGSASTATTMATDASGSAATAGGYASGALTAKGQAEAAATAAGTKAQEASGSATAAAGSAADAAQAKRDAQGAAVAANDSADLARGYADGKHLDGSAYTSLNENNAKYHADRAEDARDAVEDMTAVAVTLPAGSAATVTKTVDPQTGAVTLTFGVPRGADGSGGGAVSDVQIDGTSILDAQGAANIPIAGGNTLGVVKYNSNGNSGVSINANGQLGTIPATSAEIKGGSLAYKPIGPYRQHEASFYGLAKAAGDTTQSQSNNAVGQYTDSAKAAIQAMLGIAQMLSSSVELSTTATENHAVGSIFAHNGSLYKATATIASGTAITPGNNCVVTTVEELISTSSDGEKPWNTAHFSVSDSSEYTKVFTIPNNGTVSEILVYGAFVCDSYDGLRVCVDNSLINVYVSGTPAFSTTNKYFGIYTYRANNMWFGQVGFSQWNNLNSVFTHNVAPNVIKDGTGDITIQSTWKNKNFIEGTDFDIWWR